MTVQNILSLKKFSLYYFTAGITVFFLNILYRNGDSSLLTWILAPTAKWAGILGGMVFEPFPGKGYVNETFRFLIAPSCSGIRFLQIVLLMLVFSHTHRVSSAGRGIFWLPFCLGFSYAATVFVNGIRIALSVRLPLLLTETSFYPELLTPEKLHTLIGTTVYFSALLLLWHIASALIPRLFDNADPTLVSTSPAQTASAAPAFYPHSPAAPVFWYLAAVLGLPLLRGAATADPQKFTQYALTVILPCSAILLLIRFLKIVLKLF